MRKNCRRDSYVVLSAVYHGVVYDEHLGKVVFSFAHAQQLAFQETEAGEAPTRTGTVLVLNGCNRVFLNSGKDESSSFGRLVPLYSG